MRLLLLPCITLPAGEGLIGTNSVVSMSLSESRRSRKLFDLAALGDGGLGWCALGGAGRMCSAPRPAPVLCVSIEVCIALA